MSRAASSLAQRAVLITGGTGFVGVHLAHELALSGAQVVLLDSCLKRHTYLAPLLASGQVAFAPCDLSRVQGPSTLPALLDQVDYLVHLHLKVPVARGGTPALAEFLDSNLLPFQRLLAAVPQRLRGICLASSVSVYGPQQSGRPVPESQPPAPATPYGQAKLAMEQTARLFSERQGVPVTILRYSTLFGPGELTSLRAIPSFIRNQLKGRPPTIHGDGSDVNDYLYVKDAAQGTRLALEMLSERAGTYNLGSGQGRTTQEIAGVVLRLFNCRLGPEYMPARRPQHCLVADISRSEALLGFEPQTDLADGIAREIEDHRANLLSAAETYWCDGPAMPTVASTCAPRAGESAPVAGRWQDVGWGPAAVSATGHR